MDATSVILLVMLPLFLLWAAVVATCAWRQNGGVRRWLGRGRPEGCAVHLKLLVIVALASVWLLLTITSLWCTFLGALIVVHLLYFSLGLIGAWVGLIAAGALLACISFAWGRVILSAARQW